MYSENKGIKLALVTAVVSGFSIFINKFAVSALPSALLFTTTKNVIVALFVFSFLLILRKTSQFKFLTKRELLSLLLIGVIGGSVPFYLFFKGLTMTSAINAALIHKTLVIWVALLALPFLKEKLSKLQLVGILLLFGSNLLVGGFKGFNYSIGELLVLGATLLWAVENVIAKRVLSTVDPDIVTFFRMGIGSIILLIAAVLIEPASFSQFTKLNQTQTLWILATSLSLMAYVQSWYRALKFAPATTVSSILVVSTLVTNILSAVFITHVWPLTTMIPQTIFMLIGLFVFWYASKPVKVLETA